MYIVDLTYFTDRGMYLGEWSCLSPGTEPSALQQFIRELPCEKFLGLSPAYVCVKPEVGEPILIKLEEHNESYRLC